MKPIVDIDLFIKSKIDSIPLGGGIYTNLEDFLIDPFVTGFSLWDWSFLSLPSDRSYLENLQLLMNQNLYIYQGLEYTIKLKQVKISKIKGVLEII